MSDPSRATYEELGLVPTLNSSPPQAVNASKPPIQIRIHKAKAPLSPRPTKAPKADDVQLRAKPLRTFTKLMELPLEIRRVIYVFALTANFGVIGSRHLQVTSAHTSYDTTDATYATWRKDRIKRRSQIAAGLLRTNHQVYHESVEFLYRTDNTIIITSAKMLNTLAVIPDGRLETCITNHACQFHAPDGGPLFDNAIFYPREFDLAWSRHDEKMEYMNDYLPTSPGAVMFKHLTLDISASFALFGRLKKCLLSPALHIKESFTVRAWGFQGQVRTWIKSRDCVEMTQGRGLFRQPTIIEELPLNINTELRPWTVTWNMNKTAGLNLVCEMDINDEDEGESQATEGDLVDNTEAEVGEGDDDDSDDGNDFQDFHDDQDDEDNDTDDEDDVAPIKGLREWNQNGQCKLKYRELKHYGIPRENLDLSEIFPKVQVVRKRLERLMGGGIVGE